jgi:hypothetical protein
MTYNIKVNIIGKDSEVQRFINSAGYCGLNEIRSIRVSDVLKEMKNWNEFDYIYFDIMAKEIEEYKIQKFNLLAFPFKYEYFMPRPSEVLEFLGEKESPGMLYKKNKENILEFFSSTLYVNDSLIHAYCTMVCSLLGFSGGQEDLGSYMKIRGYTKNNISLYERSNGLLSFLISSSNYLNPNDKDDILTIIKNNEEIPKDFINGNHIIWSGNFWKILSIKFPSLKFCIAAALPYKVSLIEGQTILSRNYIYEAGKLTTVIQECCYV